MDFSQIQGDSCHFIHDMIMVVYQRDGKSNENPGAKTSTPHLHTPVSLSLRVVPSMLDFGCTHSPDLLGALWPAARVAQGWDVRSSDICCYF